MKITLKRAVKTIFFRTITKRTMTAEQLLKRRFEVTAPYPNSPFEVGDIIEFNGIVWGMNEPQKFERNPEKYPHLFKELQWWEKRSVEDMPKKVKCIGEYGDYEGKIFEVKKWDMINLIMWIDANTRHYKSCFNETKESFGYIPID